MTQQQAPPGIVLENLIRALLKRLDIPSASEIAKIKTRLDRLEKVLYQKSAGKILFPADDTVPKSRIASTVVLDFISEHSHGIDFKSIKDETGFNDKKLRNIIYRLDKTGKIKRIKRGLYKKM